MERQRVNKLSAQNLVLGPFLPLGGRPIFVVSPPLGGGDWRYRLKCNFFEEEQSWSENEKKQGYRYVNKFKGEFAI